MGLFTFKTTIGLPVEASRMNSSFVFSFKVIVVLSSHEYADKLNSELKNELFVYF